MHCKLQPHLLSLSAAVFVSTASMRLRAIQRRMGTITIAVRNDVPAAMSADTQAAFPDDHVLPSDLAAPLVLHAGSSNSRRVQQQRRRQQQRVSGSNCYVSHQNMHTAGLLNLQHGRRWCCGGQPECSLNPRRALLVPIMDRLMPGAGGASLLRQPQPVALNAALACCTHKTKKTLMNSVMNTAIGSTQKTRLRAFCLLMTHVLTRKKMRADAQAVRMGLKNQDRMIGTTPCQQTANMAYVCSGCAV